MPVKLGPITTDPALENALMRVKHTSKQFSAAELLEWLDNNDGCDQEPFTPAHAKCRCRKVAQLKRIVEAGK